MAQDDLPGLSAKPEPWWVTNRIPLILSAISILSIVLALIIMTKTLTVSEPIRFSSETELSTRAKQSLTIDVSGAVISPGVYDFSPGSRIADAIARAGGLSADADTDRIEKTINRASLLSDGMKLYFPSKNETGQVSERSLVSINSGNESQLDTLEGVGSVTAKKIIAGRPYNALEDLVTRKILSQSAFEKIKQQISL